MAIIAAVDRTNRSKAVTKEAAVLSTALDDPLHIVHVIDQSEFTDIQTGLTDEQGTPADMNTIRAHAAEHAEDAVSDLKCEYTPVGLVGDPSSKVIDYAQKNDARYIVTGGRKRSPAGKAVFGSTSQSILLNSPIPVLSIIEHAEN